MCATALPLAAHMPSGGGSGDRVLCFVVTFTSIVSSHGIALDLLISADKLGCQQPGCTKPKMAFRLNNTNAADPRNRPGNPCFEPQNGSMPVSLFYSKCDALKKSNFK